MADAADGCSEGIGGCEGGPTADAPEDSKDGVSGREGDEDPRRKQLDISTISGKLCSVEMPAWDATVMDLKAVIAAETGIPSEEQRLLLHVEELSDWAKVRNHVSNFSDGDSIMLLRVPKDTPSLRTRKRIDKEVDELAIDPPEGCSHIRRCGETNLELCGDLLGPEGTAFERARFTLQIKLPPDYPFQAPALFLRPVPFHPNVTSSGQPKCNILCEDWSPALTLTKCLLSVRSLLACPEFSDPCGNREAGSLGSMDFPEFARRAWASVDSARQSELPS